MGLTLLYFLFSPFLADFCEKRKFNIFMRFALGEKVGLSRVYGKYGWGSIYSGRVVQWTGAGK